MLITSRFHDVLRMLPLALTLLILLGQTSADAQSLAPTLASQSMIGNTVPGRFLVVYRNGLLPASAAKTIVDGGASVLVRNDVLGINIAQTTDLSPAGEQKLRAQLATDPDVEFVVQDVILSAHTTVYRSLSPTRNPQLPDALYHSAQGWAVRQVGGYGADGTSTAPHGPWDTTKGRGVRIAVLDSGVDPYHPDIAPNLILNLSEVNHAALPSPCDDGSPIDQQGHGTWTASLAAGALGASTGLVAGVAPSASILNIKVLQRMPGTKTSADPTGCIGGQASGLLSWILQGISDAVANRADIISMSFGTLVDLATGNGAGTKVLFDRATHAAASAGVILIAAAGNDGFNLGNARYVELPAQSRDVVAVVASTNPACAEDLRAGATCKAGAATLPYYANFGAPLKAVAAPGGSYPSAATLATPQAVSGWITGACSAGKPSTISGVPADTNHSLGCFALGHTAYVQAMGTSASAPLVAGAAALIRAAHPTWNAAAVIQSLRTSATSSSALAAPQINVALTLI